jgi:hypothetical protein
MQRPVLAVALCLAVVVGSTAAGCEKAEKGNPTAGSSNSSTRAPSGSNSSTEAAPSVPFAGAPGVATPLTAEKFRNDPCLALTDQQIQQLEVGSGKKTEEALGMDCIWRKPGDIASINLYFLSNSNEGLSAYYQAHQRGEYDRFEPVGEVAGFPAVFLGDAGDAARGVCYMYIGLSNQLAVQVTVQQSTEKTGTVDPCEVTKAVSQLMLENIKAGS